MIHNIVHYERDKGIAPEFVSRIRGRVLYCRPSLEQKYHPYCISGQSQQRKEFSVQCIHWPEPESGQFSRGDG